MAAPAPSKTFGSAPELLMANHSRTSLLARLGKLLLSQWDNFATEHKKVSSALTHFRIALLLVSGLRSSKSRP